MDASNSGSAFNIVLSVHKAYRTITGADTIITARGTRLTRNELAEYVMFNSDFLFAMHDARSAGKSIDDAARAWRVNAQYRGYAQPEAESLRNNVTVAYSELLALERADAWSKIPYELGGYGAANRDPGPITTSPSPASPPTPSSPQPQAPEP